MFEEFQNEKEPIESLSAITISAQPSCIDVSKSLPRIFVIGTYQLDETPAPPSNHDTQSRSGTLQLFRLEDDNTVYEPSPPLNQP